MFLLILVSPTCFVVPVVSPAAPGSVRVPSPDESGADATPRVDPPTKYGRLYRLLNQPSWN
jgi:hypothetical protein